MPTLPYWLIKLLKFGLPVLMLAAVVFGIYRAGVSAEADRNERDRLKAEVAHNNEINELERQLEAKQKAHRDASLQIADQLAANETRTAAAIAALQHGFALRLQQSGERAAIYRDLSESGSAERDRLARHAAELDGSLEQGRLLVGELRSTLAERDEQLRLLGRQLTADRVLIGSGVPEGPPTT